MALKHGGEKHFGVVFVGPPSCVNLYYAPSLHSLIESHCSGTASHILWNLSIIFFIHVVYSNYGGV